jgi:glucans biosynthesis protein
MAGTHQRNVGPMQAVPKCGARTRAGAPCASPKVAGAQRCRMHGGKGSGAPKGNHNALKDGSYTGRMLARGREVRSLMRAAQALLEELERSRGN